MPNINSLGLKTENLELFYLTNSYRNVTSSSIKRFSVCNCKSPGPNAKAQLHGRIYPKQGPKSWAMSVFLKWMNKEAA